MTAELEKGASFFPHAGYVGLFFNACRKNRPGQGASFGQPHQRAGFGHRSFAAKPDIPHPEQQGAGVRRGGIALQANGESPMVRMTAALVKISYFDLPEAMKTSGRVPCRRPPFPGGLRLPCQALAGGRLSGPGMGDHQQGA